MYKCNSNILQKKFTQIPERKYKVSAVSRFIMIIDKSSKLHHRMKTEQVSNHEKGKSKHLRHCLLVNKNGNKILGEMD